MTKLKIGEEFKRNKERLDSKLEAAKAAPTEFKVGWVYDDGNGSQWFVHFINEDGRYPIRATSLDNGGTYSYTDNGVYLDYEEQSSKNLLLHTGRKFEEWLRRKNNVSE